MTMRLCHDCNNAEALPRKQRCYECDLREQNVVVRMAAAELRLALVPEALRRGRVAATDCPEGRRFCAGCQTFVLTRDVAAGASRCRTCQNSAAHASRIKSKYGISSDDYNRLFNLQGGRCAICRNPPAKKQLAVDHDHTTGLVRGLLCSRCNDELLSAMYHKPKIAMNAYNYLTEPPTSGQWVQPEVLAGEPEPAPF